MTRYNTFNVKLPNSQFKKLKSGVKNGTEVSLNSSSKVIGDSNNRTNFPYKLLLTASLIRKFQGFVKFFANLSSANIKFSKPPLSKMIQPGEILADLLVVIPQVMFLRKLENRGILLKGPTRKFTSEEGGFFNFLRPLISAGLPLMKNLLSPSAKNVLIPLGLTAAASATDYDIQKNFWIRHDDNINNFKRRNGRYHKIVKYLEELGLLIKSISETIQCEAKGQKCRLIVYQEV